MKNLSLTDMGELYGGSTESTIGGAACGAAVSGFLFGGFPGVITSIIFGPTCVALTVHSLFS